MMLPNQEVLQDRSINIVEGSWKDTLKSRIINDEPFHPYNHIEKFQDLKEAAILFKDYITHNDDCNKKVILLTDYDCDGISSALVLTKFLEIMFVNPENYTTIVNQRKWSNGLNDNLMKEIIHIQDNVWPGKKILVVTADMCSSDNLPIETLRSRGMDVILTDHHHIPKDNYPVNANYVVNVMREDNTYPYYVSGAYTAFLLCAKVLDLLQMTDTEDGNRILNHIASYAGVSTVVDQMPLNVSYNRNNAIVGLRSINCREGSFVTLNKMLKQPPILMNKSISWSIGPFFNSGNRCNTERVLFQGMRDNDESKIKYAFQENNRRKVAQRDINKQVLEDVYKVYPRLEDVFGIAMEIETDYGVAGPVASRLGETFNRPVIIFRQGVDKEILSGSGRAIIDVDLLVLLKEIQNETEGIIYKAAGHSGACGIEIYAKNLNKFRELFSNKVKEKVNGKLPMHTLEVLSYIEPQDISLALALEVEHYGPYGKDWPEPLFITKAKYKGSYNFGSAKQCKFERFGKTTFQGIYNFDRPNGITQDNWNEKMDGDKWYYVVFSLQLGYSNNNYLVDIGIKDIFPV